MSSATSPGSPLPEQPSVRPLPEQLEEAWRALARHGAVVNRISLDRPHHMLAAKLACELERLRALERP